MLEPKGRQPARIWVVGCDSGAEVYALALSFLECAEQAGCPPKLQLFATDSGMAAIERARAGLYPKSLLDEYPKEWLHRCFIEEGGCCRVDRPLRDKIIFARLDLLQDPPLPRMGLVYCRTLPTRSDEELRRIVLPKLSYSLKPKGFLCLGESAPPEVWAGLFEPVNRKRHLFSRIPGTPVTFHFGARHSVCETK